MDTCTVELRRVVLLAVALKKPRVAELLGAVAAPWDEGIRAFAASIEVLDSATRRELVRREFRERRGLALGRLLAAAPPRLRNELLAPSGAVPPALARLAARLFKEACR
jgi:hypothetical protein